MIRKMLASATIVATMLVVAPATAQAAQQPGTPAPTAPHPRVAPVRTFHAVGTCATVGRVCLAGRAR